MNAYEKNIIETMLHFKVAQSKCYREFKTYFYRQKNIEFLELTNRRNMENIMKT
jgi:hypothetical protein